VQYSDPIDSNTSTATPDAFTISAHDIDSTTLNATTQWKLNSGSYTAGLPSSLSLSLPSTTPDGNGGASAVWSLSGRAFVPAGSYTISVTINDGYLSTSTLYISFVVSREDVSITDVAPTYVQVPTAWGTVNIPLSFTVTEAQDGYLSGHIELAQPITVAVTPIASGSSYSCTITTVTPSVTQGVGTAGCTINGVASNVYEVDINVGGNYFIGSTSSALDVVDPSLGFTTGGGWFTANDGSKVNFGFNAKILKSGQVQGSFLTIFHTASGNYIVKSNSTGTLSVGKTTASPIYGYATLANWKATYQQPTLFLCGSQLANKCGGYTFSAYVEDRGEPGAGVDRFWLEVKDPTGAIVARVSLPRDPSTNQALPVTIGGGNIQVPQPSSNK